MIVALAMRPPSRIVCAERVTDGDGAAVDVGLGQIPPRCREPRPMTGE